MSFLSEYHNATEHKNAELLSLSSFDTRYNRQVNGPMVTHLHLRSPLRTPSKILLLERSGRSRDLHAIVLMTHGHELDCTANAATAWRMWRTEKPDLIIVALDVFDPKIFGLVERIRRSDSLQLMEVLRPRLCSVLFDGLIVRGETAPDDILIVARKGRTDIPRIDIAEPQ